MFGDFIVVQFLFFKIEDGEFFMLFGFLGCGKIIILCMIVGLELLIFGEILIDGEEVSQKLVSQCDIVFVFQMFVFYLYMNVCKNISYFLISQGMLKCQVKDKVVEVFWILGIEEIFDWLVGGLFGGDC